METTMLKTHLTKLPGAAAVARLTTLGLAFSLCALTNAQLDSAADGELETFVVTPLKFPISADDVGSAVTLITGEEIESSQIQAFETAIQLSPGVGFASNGQPGSTSAVFLRGTNSNQTQFLIDGVRVNDSNILPFSFLGGESAHHLGSIEVLRGPQSSLYGGEAIGGVIALTSPRGRGAPSYSLDSEAGSFGSFGTRLTGGGEIDRLAYSFSTGWLQTDNDRTNNDFESFYYGTRLDYAVSEQTTVGLTVRGAEREFGSPDNIFVNDPDNRDLETFVLVTSYVDHQISDVWNTHLLAGWLNQDLTFENPSTATTGIDSSKVVLDWRNTFAWESGHTTLFGVGYEHISVENTGFGGINDEEAIFAVYAQQLLQVTEALSLTGGGRWEDYDSFGDVATWRGAAAYKIEQTGTTLRSSAGSGFRAPSFFELYAFSPSFVGNPNLGPEESVGWDVGVEQDLGPFGAIGLTYFQNDIKDLISTDLTTTPLSLANVGKASTSGVELDWRGQLFEQLNYRVAYTYLEADDDTSGVRLLRRPAHTLGFDLNSNLTDKLLLGVGGYWIDDRLDIDPVTFSTIAGDDYFLARAYANYEVCPGFDLHLRVENAFDQEYQEIAGFPGRGLGVFGGVKLTF